MSIKQTKEIMKMAKNVLFSFEQGEISYLKEEWEVDPNHGISFIREINDDSEIEGIVGDLQKKAALTKDEHCSIVFNSTGYKTEKKYSSKYVHPNSLEHFSCKDNFVIQKQNHIRDSTAYYDSLRLN